MSGKSFGTCAGLLAAVGLYALPVGGHRGPAAGISPTASVASQVRDDALRHARTRVGEFARDVLTADPRDAKGVLTRDEVSCTFVPHAPTGTSLKFDCALADGEIVRVKYGHQPEIPAEVAATRLLAALGYPADHVYAVRRVRCHRCPINPFVTMTLFDLIGDPTDAPAIIGDGHRDFDWVAVERKFDAPPIEDGTRQGWAWWELKTVDAPRVELDSLRLLAMFLAHWDNKADNQRLVCMDRSFSTDDGERCGNPVLMIQDVGATFGPTKVNLSRWHHMPVWTDRATCTVSMRAMPYRGATFPDTRITEAARVRIGTALASFSDSELREWLADAGFPRFYESTDDEKDLDAWLAAYRHRVQQILSAGPCPQ